MVKLTPEPLSDEEMSRLWAVFGSQYRISVGYVASVVLIKRPHPPGRPHRCAPPARGAAAPPAARRRWRRCR